MNNFIHFGLSFFFFLFAFCVHNLPPHRQTCSTDPLAGDSTENLSWMVWFFFAAQLLHGAGASSLFTLGVTYIDENVSKKMSSVYLGKCSLLVFNIQRDSKIDKIEVRRWGGKVSICSSVSPNNFSHLFFSSFVWLFIAIRGFWRIFFFLTPGLILSTRFQIY